MKTVIEDEQTTVNSMPPDVIEEKGNKARSPRKKLRVVHQIEKTAPVTKKRKRI